MFSKRRDMGTRVGGEKGQLADEFITRSQPQPGRNITFEYLANHDIVIHADTIAGGVGTSVRMFSGIVTCDLVPSTYSNGQYHVNLEGTDLGNFENFHFGKAVFIDVVHNWHLNDIGSFDYSIMRIQDNGAFVALTPQIKSDVRVIALNKDTVRIWATEIGTLTNTDWEANPDTRFFNGGGNGWLSPSFSRTVRFYITLIEKLPYNTVKFLEEELV